MTSQKILISLLLIFFVKIAIAQSSPFDSVSILLQKRVYFDFGKDGITSESENVLLEMMDSSKSEANIFVHIEAHTDHIGTNENNLALSRRRSNSVKDFFSQQEFSPEKISTSVFGEAKPIAENISDDGCQQNRRAVISFYKKNKMSIVKGKVVDKKTGEGIQVKVIFHTRNHQDSLETAPDGSFEKSVVENSIVGVDIYKKDYFFDTQMIKVKKNLVVMSIPLLPIEVGEKVAIKNLYYVGNQAVLLLRSRPELPKVLKFMQLNPAIKIEIAGHINAPFRTKAQLQKWEWDLSINRAKVIYDFLVENNIAEERLTYEGYGNTQMVFPETRNEKEQSLNRRVEIRILDTGKVISVK
jgi:outer membrane protein OmpA-like peptidoglycan-associated protein